MQKFQARSDAVDRRDFFLQTTIGSLGYAMAQDALNNIKLGPNNSKIMGTEEVNKRAYNGSNETTEMDMM